MCGIVGYVGKRDAVPILVDGLKRLEYRGYDSAGLAVARGSGLKVHKAKGRIRELEATLPKRFKGAPAIAHTRWATHGEPSDDNAHPHCDESGRIAVVHNGIIENAAALRLRLEAEGAVLRSDTDSEVLAHLIARAGGDSLEEDVRLALLAVEGTYGLAVVDSERPDRLVVARNGSPVLLGIGEREMFAASDASALVRHTQQVVHLDDGELAVLTQDGFQTSTLDAQPTTKTPSIVDWGAEAYDKGGFAHFTRKEIFEQPESVARTLQGRLDGRFQTAHLGGLELGPRELLDVRRIKLLGCGSAYYSARIGAHLLEQLTRVPTDAEPASEFRYRNPVIEKDTLYVAVSQSGETFDTLAAVQEVRRKGGRVLGIVNSVGSTIARECDGGIYLHAGPEVAVVSTKTFTSTAVALALLALHVGRVRDLSPAAGRRLIEGLSALPAQIQSVLDREAEIEALATRLAQAEHAYFIGRAAGHPVAQEGALKFKEVSYIHAEAYAASELKHGPLALVSPETPCLMVIPDDDLFEKNVSCIQEIRARRGPVVALCHREELPVDVDATLVVPKSEPELDPILMGVPLQLLAYHTAVALGRDVDQPRNLAKSVTVE
ncbi:MAG: glutamine--fructose-6-phosphate transaminase (isomerizing) [Myxococcota bacterium]|nr:glutamine--fructose-6-phosphate transaminase (isomerizing) [Myxococcota bacterium]